MNMLDGLKVSFDKYDNDNYCDGIIIQTQIIDEKFLFAIIDSSGWVYTIRSVCVRLNGDDINKIFNTPQEIIKKIRQAEIAETIEDRTEILDIR